MAEKTIDKPPATSPPIPPEEKKPDDQKPVATPETPKGPESAAVDPIFSILHSDLGVKITEGKVVRGPFTPPEKKEDKKPDETPAKPSETPAEPPEPPKEPETAKPAVEVASEGDENARLDARLSDVVDKALDKRLPKTLETPPKKDEPATDPDAAYIETLSDDWKYEVSLARLAEKKLGLKGKVKETIAFSKALDDYLDKHKDEEGRTFDESDDDYQKFLRQKRPKYSPVERRRIEVLHEVEPQLKEAKREVRSELEPKLEAAEERSREMEAKPKIAEDLKKFNAALLTLDEQSDPLLKEAVELVKAKGDGAIEDDPVYGSIVLKEIKGAEAAAAEFLALSNGLKKPDAANPLHKYLMDFMEAQGNHIATNGGEMRTRKLADGRVQTFIPRAEYSKRLNANADDTRAKHFTFSDQDVLDMLAINARGLIGKQVKTANEKLTKAGYGRQKPAKTPDKPKETPAKPPSADTPPPKPAAKPENNGDDDPDPASPKLGGAPAPGPGNKAGVTGSRMFSDRDLEVLIGKR